MHYLGVLAAAGLLTVGAAGPVMATDYDGSTTINAANPTDASGAVIVGPGNVGWDIDTDTPSGTKITNGLHFTSGTALSVTVFDADPTTAQTVATITSGGIEVTGAGAGTLVLGAYSLTVTAGGINGGAAGLTISGTGGITATSSDLVGKVDLGSNATSVSTIGANGNATIDLGAAVTVGTNIGLTGNTVDLNVNTGGSLSQTGGNVAGTVNIKNAQGTVKLDNLAGAVLDITGSGLTNVAAKTASGFTNTLAGGAGDTLTLADYGVPSSSTTFTVNSGNLTVTGPVKAATGFNTTTIKVDNAASVLTLTGGIAASLGNVAIESASSTATNIGNIGTANLNVNLTGTGTGGFTVGNVTDGVVSLAGLGTIATASGAGAVVLRGTDASHMAVLANLGGGGTATFSGTAGNDVEAVTNGASTLKGTTADAADSAGTISGPIGDGTAATILTIGAASAAVTVNDVSGSTAIDNTTQNVTINVTNDSVLNFSNTDIDTSGAGAVAVVSTGADSVVALGDIDGGGSVTLTNTDGTVDKFTIGTISGGTTAAVTNVTVAALDSATLNVTTAASVGDVTGAGNVIDGVVGGEAIALTGAVGDNTVTTDLVFGSAANKNVAVTGTGGVAGKAAITIDNGSTVNLSGDITGTDNVITNTGAITNANFGVIKGTVEANYVTFASLDGGTLVVNEYDVVTGDVTGASTIKGKGVAPADVADVTGNIGADTKTTTLAIGTGTTDAVTVNVAGDLVGTGGGSTVITVADGSTLDQSTGTIAGRVTVVNNSTSLIPEDDVSVGSLADASELEVGGAIKVAGLASPGTATVYGNGGGDDTAYIQNIALNAGNTTLNFGRTGDSNSIAVIYDQDLNIAAGANLILARQDTVSTFTQSGEVTGNLTIGNGVNIGDLAGANIIVADGSTGSTIDSVKAGTSNTINGNGAFITTRTTIDGGTSSNAIDASTAIAPTSLTVGNNVNPVTVEVDGDIISNNIPGNEVYLTVNKNAALKQISGIVSGTVVAGNNADNAATALTLGSLNGATIQSADAITITGTESGTSNIVQGGGTFHVDAAGFGGGDTLNVLGSTVMFENAGTTDTIFNLDAATGQTALSAANATGDVEIGVVNLVNYGANDITIASGAAGDLTTGLLSAATYAGTGKLVLDGSAGYTGAVGTGTGVILNGVNVATTQGSGSTVDFKGNVGIDATAGNNLKVDILNYQDAVVTTVGGPVITNVTSHNIAGNVIWNPGATNKSFSTVDTFNAGFDGNAATEATFATTGYQDVVELNVLGKTTFNSNVTVASAYADASANSGLYVDTAKTGAALNVDKTMTMGAGSKFTVENGASTAVDTTIHFTSAPAAYTPMGINTYGTAIVVGTAADADVSAIAYFDVPDLLSNPNTAFQVIGAADGSDMTGVWRNFDYSGVGYGGYGTGAAYYNKGNGLFASLDAAHTMSAINSTPKYGQGYVNALMYRNTVLADAIGNGYFNPGVPSTLAPYVGDNAATGHRVLNMAMGHTLNAAHMTTNNVLLPIMNNLNTLHPQTENRIARSAGDSENFGLWITPNFSYRSIDGDYAKGYGGDIDIRNYGVTLGFDSWLNEQFRLGLFAGFNSGDLDADFENIDSDDFQLGVYGQAVLPEGFMLNAGFAYGWQSYDAKRHVITGVTDYDQRIKSSFDGNTVTAALELNKVFSLDYDMFLRPTIGYTYMGVDLDSYREKSDNWVNNLSQKVKDTSYDLHLIRVGTDIGWTAENAAVIGRLYYVGNAGDTDVKTRANLVSTPEAPFTIRGAEYDDNMANLGLTLKVAPAENSHFAVDYDALLGSKSTTHNVNLTYKLEW